MKNSDSLKQLTEKIKSRLTPHRDSREGLTHLNYSTFDKKSAVNLMSVSQSKFSFSESRNHEDDD